MAQNGTCGEHRRPRILLVDDSPINTRILSQALSDYETFTAANGLDAVSLALAELPDLILLDIQMPGMDGIEVCRYLKSEATTREIPVIFLTGVMEPGAVARGFQAGAVDYITKPFDFSEVKARIATQLELCRTRRELEEQNRLLERTVREQQLNIALARRVLELINGPCPRYHQLAGGLVLFTQAMCVPCREAGGDHYLVRTVKAGEGNRTVLAVKDQSGHAVNCILRSITTDLLHNVILSRQPAEDLAATVGRLNDTICRSGFFAGDDFCTAVIAELDHRDLCLRFVSAGHPPLLLVRDDTVLALPAAGGHGANLPLAVQEGVAFQAGEVGLRTGDRLLFYTDGLLELAAGRRGRPLRQAELVELVASLVAGDPGMPVTGLARRLLAALTGGGPEDDAFGAGLTDDVTLLVAQVETGGQGETLTLSPQECGSIDNLVAKVMTWLAMDDDRAAMALGEALLNAYRHGNQGRDDLPITVQSWTANDRHVAITDQGPGFDPETVADPSTGEGLFAASGRGIFIMRRFSQWVRWEEGGRRVVLTFAGTGLPGSPTADSTPLLDLWQEGTAG